MRCPHCGSQLSLEDKVCPFCGTENNPAKPYTETMNVYETELRNAANKVEKTTSLVRNYIVFLVVAIFLVLMNLIVVTLKANVYDIQDWLRKNEAEEKFPIYKELINDAYENRNYLLAYHYYRDNDLDYLGKNNGGNWHTMEFVQEFNGIVEDTIYLTDQSANCTYRTNEDLLDQLAAHIIYFYQDYDHFSESYVQKISDENDTKIRNQLKNTTDRYLQYYLKLSQEQVDSFADMSKAEIAMIIGRSLGIYE